MLYKRSITIAIFVLLVLVILVAIWFARKPINEKAKFDITNRIHTSLYQKASDVWDGSLTTDVFPTSPSTGIHLSWRKPAQKYNHFLITVTNAQTGWTRTESGEHERVTLDLTDMLPDTKYTFIVQACVDPKCSSWMIADEEVSARTAKAENQTSTTSNASP
jgi:hypothetical protein